MTRWRPMKNKKKIKKYFGEEEENAIRNYLLSQDAEEKEDLFNNCIYKALDKLSENIINTYKFYNTGYDYETLKGDVTSFLVQKLDYFDPTKNSKAYSYFGTVAKHYLTQETRRKNRLTYYNENSEDQNNIIKNNHHHHLVPIKAEDSELVIIFKDSIIERLPRIEKLDQNYASFLQALLLIMQTYTTLEYMNKKYIKLYMKESSGLSDKQISKYLNKTKKDFLGKIYKKYINNSL